MDGAKAEEVEQEREAFIKICRAIQGYAADAAEEVHRWERMFERLPPAHQTLLAHHRDKHVEAYRCVSRNDKFLQGMLATYMGDDVPPHLRVPPAEGTDATGRSTAPRRARGRREGAVRAQESRARLVRGGGGGARAIARSDHPRAHRAAPTAQARRGQVPAARLDPGRGVRKARHGDREARVRSRGQRVQLLHAAHQLVRPQPRRRRQRVGDPPLGPLQL